MYLTVSLGGGLAAFITPEALAALGAVSPAIPLQMKRGLTCPEHLFPRTKLVQKKGDSARVWVV